MKSFVRPVALVLGFFGLWYGFMVTLSLAGMPTPSRLRWLRLLNPSRPSQGGAGLAPEPVLATTPDTPELSGSAADPVPNLPRRVFATVGRPFYLYFDPIVLSRDPDKYRVEVDCSCGPGSAERRRWAWTPALDAVGKHRLAVRVSNWKGRVLAAREVTLIVNAPPTDLERKLNLLLVGASITHQSAYPNVLRRMFREYRWNHVRFVGTHHPIKDMNVRETALPGVFHEGYGGWTWERFTNHYKPGEEKTYYVSRSPFVFLNAEGKPELNVAAYLQSQGVSQDLHVAIFELGLNDTFSLNPDDRTVFEASIEAMVNAAENLLGAFHRASPKTVLGVLVPVPFTRSAVTFEHAYGWHSRAFADPWRHRRIQHRLAQAMIARFEGKEGSGIHLIPVHAGFDVVDGYWVHDAVHPNPMGAQLYANSIFAWLIDRLSELS